MGTTLNLFENALAKTLRRELGPNLELTITDNRRHLISIRRAGKKLYVRLSRIFAYADRATMRELIEFLKGRSSKVPPRVKDFIDSQPLPSRLAKKALLKLNPKGVAYDLRRISEKINRRYFKGAMKIKITWGRARAAKRWSRRGTIQLGSYDKDLDLITIHPVLDCKTVPVEVVELVVYHEMLHKKLGVTTLASGRKMTHTPRFRQMEKSYSRYEEAVEWERKNLGRLLRARRRLGQGAGAKALS